jgi:preprotein translocase subunit SecG
MLFTFVLIVQTLVAALLVTVILMQRSEGGGLVASSGGSLMTARGAADFLTRATAVLATLFVILSIVLAALAAVERAPSEIDASLARPKAPVTAPQPGLVPLADGDPADPLAGVAKQAGTDQAAQPANPAGVATANEGAPAPKGR